MDALEDLVKGIFGSLQRGSFKEKPGQFQVYFTQGKSSRVKRILIVFFFIPAVLWVLVSTQFLAQLDQARLRKL